MIHFNVRLKFACALILLASTLFPSPTLAMPRLQDDPKTQADKLYDEGVKLIQSDDFAAALEKFERALPLYKQAADPYYEALCLLSIGFARDTMADDEGALEAYQASLRIWEKIGEPNGTGATLTNIGDLHRSQGNLRQALDYYQRARTVWQEINNREVEGRSLNLIGLTYRGLGQYARAQESYEQALEIAQDTGDPNLQGAVLDNLGLVHNFLGQFDQALDYHQQALAIAREAVDWETEAWVLNNMGSPHENKGEYEQALKSYQQAKQIFHDHEHLEGEEATLNNIGGVYRHIGQYTQAIDFFEQALRIAREIGDREGEAVALNNLGVASDNLGQFQQAVEYYQQALAIAQESGRRAEQATALSNIGLAYDGLGDYQQALRYLQQALPIRDEVGDQKGQASTLTNLGTVYYHLKHDGLALDHYRQALGIFQRIGDRAGEGITLNDIGKTYLAQGNTGEAIQAFQQSIDALESIQGKIRVEEFAVSFANQQVETYQRLINLLWDEGRFEEAFNYTERARAQAFLDGLANGALDYRAHAAADLLKHEQELRNEIAAFRAELITLRSRPQNELDVNAIAAVETELAARETDYAQLLTDIKLQSPEVASLVSVDVVPLADIQNLLDPQKTLVEYFVTEDRILVFIITHDTFETVSIAVQQDELAQTIATFREFGSLEDPYPASLRQLHTWLITPVKEKLQTRVIGIIPHGVLHYLSFAALTDGTGYLSDEYSLFSLPSASVLRFIQEKRKSETNTIIALGNPTTDLPRLEFAGQEAESIAKLYGTQALVGSDAVESIVWSQAGTASTLHLAAHGEYNPDNPLFSAIRLAGDSQNDGRLEVHEVYGLDLTKATNLVVLSACETSVGTVSAGDEVVGLNRAFIYAGTPTVIASLWNVNDEASAQLMERFYIHLRAGLGKAEALQAAQKEIRDNPKWAHPYYWAAFVLTGDPGSTSESRSILPPTISVGRIAGLLLCLVAGGLLAFSINRSIGKKPSPSQLELLLLHRPRLISQPETAEHTQALCQISQRLRQIEARSPKAWRNGRGL